MELPPLRCVKKSYIFFETPFLEESIDIYIVPKNIAPWPQLPFYRKIYLVDFVISFKVKWDM